MNKKDIEKSIKMVSMALIVIMIILLVLFALGRIPQMVFWVNAGVIAILAYWVIPRIRKKFV
ncbi:hypothetical protein ACFL0W_04855 [Nanoarchaeota archaeon]